MSALAPGAASFDWPLYVQLAALAGTAATLAARERSGGTLAIGLMMWALIAVLLASAWRSVPAPTSDLITACGAAVIGFLAWACAPAADIPARAKSWLPSIVLASVCGAFGILGARDLLGLAIWLAVLGAANFTLVLAGRERGAAAHRFLQLEALALLLATLAIVALGAGHTGAAGLVNGQAPALAAAGLILLVTQLLVRSGAALASLAVLARPGMLGLELAAGALTLPSLLVALARICAEFAPVWPEGFGAALGAVGQVVMIGCGAGFLLVRGRGPRLSLLGASLAGVAVLIAANDYGKSAASFTELLFIPFAAIIAGSSLYTARTAPGIAGSLELGLGLAALGAIGLPPFAGFWPRLLLLDEAARAGNLLIPIALVLGSLVLAGGLIRPAPAPVEVAARRPMRSLELAAFGILLGLSLAAGLVPGPALEASSQASPIAVSEAR